MTVTIKVNYQTTFQKKEAKNKIEEKEERAKCSFLFLKLLSGDRFEEIKSKFTFYIILNENQRAN